MGLSRDEIISQKQVIDNKENRGKAGWALALERAELALYKNRARRSQIMQAIRLFQGKIKEGAPWPLQPKLSKKR
jgi:hypothetical protein